MRRNVAGQFVGAGLVLVSTGAAFTGPVTVYVTGDAGTQAVGSVGAGACTHAGNGYHTYAPAQAETNYNLVAFTFTGTGAVPVTVQVYTRWDANLEAMLNDADGVSRLERAARAMTLFTVDAASSVTSIVTSSLVPAAIVNDQFKNATVVFDMDTATAALRGQRARISASTSGGVLTVSTLTTVPASGDTGVII